MDASFLDQFIPALASTLVGGVILLVGGTYGIDRWLQRKERRARLHIVRSELEDAWRKVDRFTKMVDVEHAAPYARFGVRGWDLLSEGRVLDALDPTVGEKLRKAYEAVLLMNAKLDRYADLKLGTPAFLAQTSTAAAHDALVAELEKNMLCRLPGLSHDIGSAIAALPR